MPDFGEGYRGSTWDEAASRVWDVVVIGGGITGAGVAKETARLGLSVLLVEQRDFAWGTSSRSSKMVHGGLRYLRERQIQLTREAVRERESLLRTGKGLVEPLRFLYVVYQGDRPGPWMLDFGLSVYDLLKKGGKNHHGLDALDVWLSAPNLDLVGLRRGFAYLDAQTDDARLVFRVLREAMSFGARALNYARADELLRDREGNVRAVAVSDADTGSVTEVKTRFVVNATGVWSAEIVAGGGAPRLRPLRGSHLVLPREKLPVAQAITFAHPRDGRPVFSYPWEGVTLVGTTDLDHDQPLRLEPAATREESDYLLEAVRHRFKDIHVSPEDLLGTFAGVRPVIFGGRDHPSQEPREHAIWRDKNYLAIAGGKLTTFHPMAREAVRTVAADLGRRSNGSASGGLEPLQRKIIERANETLSPLPHLLRRRLAGRLGPDLEAFLEWMREDDLQQIADTPYTWAELRWAFEREAVVHLEDLLLRRVRLGHLLPGGGRTLGGEMEARLKDLPGWDPGRWEAEWRRYLKLWETHYSPEPAGS
ncbi:MAG TPA: glycerol-3-phosphate dehydrogenase/oxidase [Rubrobacteraceae bacterium]|nr:glycerol-3-phosphate dehydrogenase/oxidase [Rubrobacteraceae bacterium]